MTMHDAKNREILRAHGFRCTRGRMQLLSVLKSARRPLSHSDILERMEGSRLDRVSVYRALDAFVGAGLVHRAYTDGRTGVFELPDHCEQHRCHPHFTCHECGNVTCMTEVLVPLARGLPKGYVAERQKVHIEGVCASCAAHPE